MSERKVLNKYYPPDFDPSKIPRMKLPKNRQYTVRLMAPFNMKCKTCGEYIYKGKKFNARKEDVENEDYLGIRIYRFYIKDFLLRLCNTLYTGARVLHRYLSKTNFFKYGQIYHCFKVFFYNFPSPDRKLLNLLLKLNLPFPSLQSELKIKIKCTRCLQEISFKTDPRNTDYEIEAGATRNFMALKLAEEQAIREEEEAKEEEASNPMKLLENRTKQSKNEIELLESLEELKDLNRRQEAVDFDSMLLAYDPTIPEKEREERMQQMDDEFIKTVKFRNSDNNKRKVIVEEEIIEEDEPPKKISKPEVTPKPEATSSGVKKSVGITSRKVLAGLVKVKKDEPKKEDAPKKEVTNALSLLGAYSDSDNSD